MSTVSIVIATRHDRPLEARRARDGYLRETPGDPQILLYPGRTNADAWQTALLAGALQGDLLHFTSDCLEPHPGWLEAGTAAVYGDRVPAPVLWSEEGVPSSDARDWSTAAGSPYPLLSRQQLRMFGLPPLFVRCGASFVLRSGYAFTRFARWG